MKLWDLEQVVLDIVEKLGGETPRQGHRTTIEHAGFFTQAQVLRIHITSNVSSSYNNFLTWICECLFIVHLLLKSHFPDPNY